MQLRFNSWYWNLIFFAKNLEAFSEIRNILPINIHDMKVIQKQVEPKYIGWLTLDFENNCSRPEELARVYSYIGSNYRCAERNMHSLFWIHCIFKLVLIVFVIHLKIVDWLKHFLRVKKKNLFCSPSERGKCFESRSYVVGFLSSHVSSEMRVSFVNSPSVFLVIGSCPVYWHLIRCAVGICQST
jgi:hypothetical protein